MSVIGRGETRHGRGFPVEEAARLLAAGVYLPDYPAELIAEAWRLNYAGAVAALELAQTALHKLCLARGSTDGYGHVFEAINAALPDSKRGQ